MPDLTAGTEAMVSREILFTASAVKGTKALSIPELSSSSIVRSIAKAAVDNTLRVIRWITRRRSLILPGV